MTWNEYVVVFSTALGTERDKRTLYSEEGEIIRYIRATSVEDAKYRVVRKFILPKDAEIVNVERVN